MLCDKGYVHEALFALAYSVKACFSPCIMPCHLLLIPSHSTPAGIGFFELHRQIARPHLGVCGEFLGGSLKLNQPLVDDVDAGGEG